MPNSVNGFEKKIPSLPNDSDHPHNTQMIPTTAMAAKDIIIMFSTDFDRDMPP